MDDESIVFADKARGVFASSTGNLYLTTPNTFDLHSSPFVVPTPFRILVHEKYDPFLIVLTQSSIIYVLDRAQEKWVLQTTLPMVPMAIDSIDLIRDARNVVLKTTKGTFLYDDGWYVMAEPFNSLVVKVDQKIAAQCSCLENEIMAANFMRDFDMFSEAAMKYLVFLASFAPEKVFLEIWYDLIRADFSFDREELCRMWMGMTDTLGSVDRVAQLIDELKMSLGEETF